MTALISHPFRIAAGGAVATEPDGSDDYYAEQLAVLLLTRPGERPLAPTFGIEDPAFAEVDAAVLTAAVDTFGPPVQLTRVRSVPVSDTRVDVTVEYEG